MVPELRQRQAQSISGEGVPLSLSHAETDVGKPSCLTKLIVGKYASATENWYTTLQRGLRYVLIGCELELPGGGEFCDWHIGEGMDCGGTHLNSNLGLAKSLPYDLE